MAHWMDRVCWHAPSPRGLSTVENGLRNLTVRDAAPCCYILLAPHGDGRRQQSARLQMEVVDLDYRFIIGFSPQDPLTTQSYSKFRNALLMKRPLSMGEVAVYLGHQKIWSEILESNAPWGLVLEDDFSIADQQNFVRDIENAAQFTGQLDIIKLFNFQKKGPLFVHRSNNIRIGFFSRPNSGLVGYIITRSGCEKLLKQKHIFRPVDEELRYWFQSKLKIASVLPNLVEDNGESLDGSLLQHDREQIRKNRSIIRSLYANLITLYINVRSHRWSRKVVDDFKKGQ